MNEKIYYESIGFKPIQEKYKIKAYNMKIYDSTSMKMKNEKYSMGV